MPWTIRWIWHCGRASHSNLLQLEGRKEMFYLTTHSTHFIYGYTASDLWLRTILTVRKETRCRHIGYSFRLTARVLLYAPSHRQDSTYHDLCYTSRGALAGTRNSSMGPAHEGSIRRPIAPCGCLYTRVRQLVMNRRIGCHQTNECFIMMQDFFICGVPQTMPKGPDRPPGSVPSSLQPIPYGPRWNGAVRNPVIYQDRAAGKGATSNKS